jgi:hypothetical protein
MERSLRQIDPSVHLTSEATLEVMGEIVSQTQLQKVLVPIGKSEIRVRKLTMVIVVLICIAMNLFTEEAIEDVLAKLMQGPRFLRPEDDIVTASKGAICQRRRQLGVAPMVSLFHEVCQPMATPDTPGAYLFGLRVVAIDGTKEDIADTPGNADYFGRPVSGRGDGAFPQVLGVYLCECGTHAICDAGFWPCQKSENPCGRRMLRSVGPGMLVMWDCGFHSFDMCKICLEKQGSQFLSRLPAKVKPIFHRRLSDGSYLAYIRPSDPKRRKHEKFLVRVIEYKLDDPGRPGHGERRRLITSFLDEVAYPVKALACAYHQRWEVEITIDEMDTHQRQPKKPLRSRTPLGVLQELYGLLIAHYCVRKVMHDAALQAGLAPDRLSFIKSVRILRSAVFEFQIVDKTQQALLYQQLLKDIARNILPERANRSNPRVVKRKMSGFDKKRIKHRSWPQPTKSFSEAVVMLI